MEEKVDDFLKIRKSEEGMIKLKNLIHLSCSFVNILALISLVNNFTVKLKL